MFAGTPAETAPLMAYFIGFVGQMGPNCWSLKSFSKGPTVSSVLWVISGLGVGLAVTALWVASASFVAGVGVTLVAATNIDVLKAKLVINAKKKAITSVKRLIPPNYTRYEPKCVNKRIFRRIFSLCGKILSEMTPERLNGRSRQEKLLGQDGYIGDIDIERLLDPNVEGVDVDKINPLDTDNFYRAEATNHPLLSHEEEIALGKLIERGREASAKLTQNPNGEFKTLVQEVERGKKAKDRLTMSNTRLVLKSAAYYARRTNVDAFAFLDIVSEGNIGLLRAIEKWDYRKGKKFSTYATWWINQSISKAIIDKSRAIRLPVRVFQDVGRMTKTVSSLRRKLEREPLDAEICQELGFSEEKLDILKKNAKKIYSLDLPIPGKDDQFVENVLANEDDQVEKRLDYVVLGEKLMKLMETLEPREEAILVLRYLKNENMTLQEIGNKFGLTKERIRQIEERALAKLRNKPEAKELLTYLKS